ncbi:MAG: hypothetical protein R3B06_27200 [Kofleriaceae bacterium]
MASRSWTCAATMLLLGCGGVDAVPVDAPTDPTRCSSTIGDRRAPIELIPVALEDVVIADGDRVSLLAPPQGGIVLVAGVRAKNVDGCATQITAALRDPVSNALVGVETRPAPLYAGADGWGHPITPTFFALANVAVCPATAATRDIFDQPWIVEFQLEDGARRAVASRTITPTCEFVDPMWNCPCQCAAGSVGGTCGVPEPGVAAAPASN